MMFKTKIQDWELSLPDHRYNFFYSNPLWEKERILALSKNIKQGSKVIDIGAEEGDITALMALWAGNGNVYIIEPSPAFWPNIKKTFKANNLKPWYCFPGFASDVADMEPVNLNYDPDEDNGWPACANGRVTAGVGFRHLAQETDATLQMTVDDLFHMRECKVNVMNIDVEGSELRVLRGAKILLKEDKPLVFVSVHPQFMEEMYGHHPKNITDFMIELGYRVKHLATDHEDHLVFYHPKGQPYNE